MVDDSVPPPPWSGREDLLTCSVAGTTGDGIWKPGVRAREHPGRVAMRELVLAAVNTVL